ncbi:hypothetical protein [Desulfurobacterium indicum]|uniref:Flagellar assembly protein FliH/Type III secretion system HrpE domain-containing protein n=1 Tax=Desulfurobacterium indicum TaxID=1914305 RepID=A0A1R1MKK6_9BACT|nr:hypothetical protein [Desulfurobacterium indicum]OMH40348.1 hypothetical protein BLW93_05630 [Desulfurobacterium indicum]
MLNLDDFSHLLTDTEKRNMSPEEIERIYIARMEELEKKYRQLLKKVEEEAFNRGYLKGKEDSDKEWQRKLEIERQRINEKIKQDAEALRREVKQFLSSVREGNVKFTRKILEIVADSLDEIFRFLLISDDNLPFVKEKVEEILEEFKSTSTVISIETDESLADVLKDIDGITIKINKDLESGNFIIKFEDFTVVHDVKEKLSLLREEIEREIKKSSSL